MFFSSCLSSQTLPKFSYNGKFYNSLITDRKPDYGDGHPDGCLVRREFSCTLKSDTDSGFVAEISDAVSHEFIAGSLVKIFFANTLNPDTLIVNNQGYVKFSGKKAIVGISLNAIGYRTIYVNLKKKPILN